MLYNKELRPVYVPSKTELDFYVTRSGKTVAVYSGSIYEVAKAPKMESTVPQRKPGRPKWIPPKDHPWRKFVAKFKRG